MGTEKPTDKKNRTENRLFSKNTMCSELPQNLFHHLVRPEASEFKGMLRGLPLAVRPSLSASGQPRGSSLGHLALLQSRCVSCHYFGGFLFLPTCERVCFECLYENQAFRMTTPTLAKQCFALTDNDLEQIPLMHSIPGTFGLRFQFAHKQVEHLVSVKQAKQLALQVHGSPEQLAELRPKFRAANMTPRVLGMFRHFHEAPLEPPACVMSRLPRKAEV